MIKWIKKFFLKGKLKELDEQELSLMEKRSKLVYKPTLDEIPDKLDKCVKIAKAIKKIHKKKNKIKERLSELNES